MKPSLRVMSLLTLILYRVLWFLLLEWNRVRRVHLQETKVFSSPHARGRSGTFALEIPSVAICYKGPATVWNTGSQNSTTLVRWRVRYDDDLQFPSFVSEDWEPCDYLRMNIAANLSSTAGLLGLDVSLHVLRCCQNNTVSVSFFPTQTFISGCWGASRLVRAGALFVWGQEDDLGLDVRLLEVLRKSRICSSEQREPDTYHFQNRCCGRGLAMGKTICCQIKVSVPKDACSNVSVLSADDVVPEHRMIGTLGTPSIVHNNRFAGRERCSQTRSNNPLSLEIPPEFASPLKNNGTRFEALFAFTLHQHTGPTRLGSHDRNNCAAYITPRDFPPFYVFSYFYVDIFGHFVYYDHFLEFAMADYHAHLIFAVFPDLYGLLCSFLYLKGFFSFSPQNAGSRYCSVPIFSVEGPLGRE